ncbi:SAM-dependent methyltransferase [Microbispora sp. H13382]|uniref:SAM-dependent methyltransferase n=1 Tax=Microbispora sp. H13382 TaxID=2729112 RepID=UPI001603EE8C|nr:SAM-dependent methyltransferase [Microbispora sp. H13382]
MITKNRAFLGRAVRYLAAECGIRGFLDLGAGLPTQGNVHEIALEEAPDSFVTYVDDDAVVAAHGRALLEGDPRVRFLRGDLRRPEEMARAGDVYGNANAPFEARPGARIARFFDGFDLVEPGLVPLNEWRPGDDAPPPRGGFVPVLGGVARRP